MSIRELIPWNWGRKSVPVQRKEAEDPFRELQRRMNALFDEVWNDFRLPSPLTAVFGSGRDFVPGIDLKETEKELCVRAELPGLSENDVQVELSGGVLTIKGEKKEEKRSEKDGAWYSECSYGSFHRSLPLPCEVEQEGVKADFKNGVLTVTLPKSAKAIESTRHIVVKQN